jgi:tetratricopeptide (TPR) repeat protein
LRTGDYTRCCIPSCEVVVDIQPPDGQEHKFFMRKEDLTGEEARVFAERESKISGLALASTTTQLLKAHLYTSWKLSEAAGEVRKLDEQLDQPAAKQQLGRAYAAVMVKTGDLLVKVDQKDRAVVRYKKAIDLPPDKAATQDRSEIVKAAAHSKLAEIYVDSGKKADAVKSLTSAKEIYLRQGDEKKAQATSKRALTMKQP